MRGRAVVLVLGALGLACAGPPAEQGLSPDQVQRHVRGDAEDPAAWAAAVHAGLVAAGQTPDADRVCQVLAVIEQESGYDADPAVPGLADIVQAELEAAARDKLGFLGPTALELLLDVAPQGETRTFRDRLGAVQTERELDQVFRDLVDHHAETAPRLARAVELLRPRLEDRLNPISTAGSMQVNVLFAQDHPQSRGMEREQVRELLYTVDGGVKYGTLRLFSYDADYDAPIYRFADYNAGEYASRNAAFQDLLSGLVGVSLVPDGDLLVYTSRGKVAADQPGQSMAAAEAWRVGWAPEMSPGQLRRDLEREKSRKFERTETWQGVRAAWATDHGEPPYARVPDVALDSPKLRGDWTTRTFAERVDRRYRDCLGR